MKTLIYTFVFLGLVIWQQLESVRKAYELKKHYAELARVESQNSRLFSKLMELKSSDKMMHFAALNKFTFPKANEIIHIRLCQKKER